MRAYDLTVTGSLAVSGSSQLIFTDDGNLGIGTANPGATLDVGGSVIADPTILIDSATGGDPQLHFDTGASNRNALIKFLDQGTNIGFINYVHNGDKMNFGAGSSTSVRMTVSEATIEFPTAKLSPAEFTCGKCFPFCITEPNEPVEVAEPLIEPITSKATPGLDVPMPTFELASSITKAVLFVKF